MDADQGESIRFWQTAPLAGVELLPARYIEQRSAPHVHDGYVIGMIMAGAPRNRYRVVYRWRLRCNWDLPTRAI